MKKKKEITSYSDVMVEVEPIERSCSNCTCVIEAYEEHLSFAGDPLHTFCLTPYLYRLGVLKVMIPKGKGSRICKSDFDKE